MEKPIYDFNNEKNLKLLQQRGIGFEEIIAIIEAGGCLAVIDHPSPDKYPNQQIYIVNVGGYVYLVPFEKQGHRFLLKTIYPSRKMTRLYREKLLGVKLQ